MRSLFAIKGFMLFLSIAFINAFVDLGHKILIQNTIFKTFDGEVQIILSALVNALILLPFIFMMSPSSFIADKYPKNKVMEYSALAAVIVTSIITVFYYLAWFWPAFIMTLILAIQSAIYSPAKYGYIKELVGIKQLAAANGLVQAATTTAILLGTLAFSFGFEILLKHHPFTTPSDVIPFIAPLGFVLIGLSIIEWLFAMRLQQKHQGNSELRFDNRAYFTGHSGMNILRGVKQHPVIFRCIIGLAIFWSLCQVMLATFPAFAKEAAAIENTVLIQGAMAFAGIGIVIGAAIAGKISRNFIETGLIPVAALGFSIAVGLISFALTPVLQAAVFFMMGIFGGLYLVPLNALIQYHANTDTMGQTLAGSNFVQNVFMLLFLVLTITLAFIGINSIGIFSLLLLIAIAGTVYTIHTLPQSLARFVVARIFSLRYRLTVLGMEKLPAKGPVLLLGNHISWIDWAVLQMASPRPIRFVMAKSIYERWYLRFILKYFNIIPVSAKGSKQSLEKVRDTLNAGEVVCLFPEGAISRNGHLGEFHRGFEIAAEGTNAAIVPFYLRGLWGSRFSRSSTRLKQQRRSGIADLIVAFGNAMPTDSDRFAVKQAVTQLSVEAWSAYTQSLESLPASIIHGLKRSGSQLATADIIGDELSGYRLLAAAINFSKAIPKHSQQNIGLLLPSSNAGVIANIASLLRGKTIVNLNFTASAEALSSAIETSQMDTIITSRRFVNKLADRGFNTRLLTRCEHILYMEDIKATISKMAFIRTLLAVRILPAFILKKLYSKNVALSSPAMILFSSGSEGAPKGVLLSHRNVISNIKQVADILNTKQDDVIMSTLPLFHAFGLTVTTLLPLVESLPIICHPDPTDARNIAKGIARYQGTLLCGTSTFLRLYVRDRKVEPLMLDSLRIVVAGAEKLNPEVREQFKLKFNKDIYEGYGATETTPVASVNMPDILQPDTMQTQTGNKPGTVGMPLPGTRFRIVNPDTLEDMPAGEDGLIMIGGNQVMLGYLGDPEKTATVITEQDGVRWYHTGDKGHLDLDGFLIIVDRYSRFAKVGGEMISLGDVEARLKQAFKSDIDILATTAPDDKKGEKIVLLYTADLDEVTIKSVIADQLPALMRPSKLVKVDEIPKLGSGKTDFSKAKQLALT